MEGPSLWEAIVQLLIEWEQVHVVHGNVVCAVAAFQEARVDERCPVEPEMIHLVEHIDVVLDLLLAQEAVHVGHKDQELLKAFSKGHQHCQAVGAP